MIKRFVMAAVAVGMMAGPAFAAVSRDGVRLLLSGKTSSGRRAMPDGRVPSPAAGTGSIFRWKTSRPRSSGSARPASRSVTRS